LKIVRSGSTKGISSTSYYIETVNFAMTAALSMHLGLQFSVYGETLIILVQNLIIILMLWSINPMISLLEKIGFIAFFSAFGYLIFEATHVPEEAWAMFSSISIVLNISSRIPQVLTNYKAQSTGELAFVTFFLAWGGSVARTATVMIESDDFMYRMQFLIALGLNSMIMIQFVMYWNTKSQKKSKRAKIVKKTQ
jgi:mannose-P-dolichol utilization defect 1